MKIYLLNPPFVENFVRCGRWQGAAARSGGLVEKAHINYVASADGDFIPLKNWLENLVCDLDNSIVAVEGRIKNIRKGLWKGVIVLALNILFERLDIKEMFIVKKYQVPDFFDEYKREKLDLPWPCSTRWNTVYFESSEAVGRDNRTDSSPKNLQTLDINSPLYHKTSVQELGV